MIEGIVGFFTGIAASLGLGGGFILIIYLTLFANIEQRIAQGANILFFLPIAFISVAIHWKNGFIEWKRLPVICGFGVAGALLGLWLGNTIDSGLLQKLFAGLLIIVGLKELFHKSEKKAKNNK